MTIDICQICMYDAHGTGHKASLIHNSNTYFFYYLALSLDVAADLLYNMKRMKKKSKNLLVQ